MTEFINLCLIIHGLGRGCVELFSKANQYHAHYLWLIIRNKGVSHETI